MEPAPAGSRELAMAENDAGETAAAVPHANGGDFANISEEAQVPANGKADSAGTPAASDSTGATTVFVLVMATFLAFALYLALFSEIGEPQKHLALRLTRLGVLPFRQRGSTPDCPQFPACRDAPKHCNIV